MPTPTRVQDEAQHGTARLRKLGRGEERVHATHAEAEAMSSSVRTRNTASRRNKFWLQRQEIQVNAHTKDDGGEVC